MLNFELTHERQNRLRQYRFGVLAILFVITLLLLQSCGLATNSKTVTDASLVAPVDLTVGEGFVDPLNYHDPSPRFSWKLSDTRFGAKQTSYQLQIAKKQKHALIWDSGKVDSSQSVYVETDAPAFTSRDEVYWRVRYWDQYSQMSNWSSWASIEYGLLTKDDWSAKWVHQPKRKDFSDITITKAVYGLRKAGKDITQALLDSLDGDNNGLRAIRVGEGALFARDDHIGSPMPIIIYYHETEQDKHQGQHNNMLKERQAMSWDGYLVDIPPTSISNVPYFRKEFELEQTATKARLYVTARGLFDVEINGKKVGQDAFTPGWTDYMQRIETLTYDVTDHLVAGKNVIGARVGKGWYAGNINRGMGGQLPQFLAQLEVELKSGKNVSVVTDDSWTYSDHGPELKSEIYWGEDYDANREIDNWSSIGEVSAQYKPVGTSELDHVILSPKIFQTVSVQKVLKPNSISSSAPDKVIFDMGQNMVGWPAINLPVKKGQKLTIRVAEMLNQDGSLYTENYRAARSMATYLPNRDGMVKWKPTFTFFGYRYLELSGYDASFTPEKDWVSGEVLHSGFAQTGTFNSSHKKLNQLQSNIEWGQRGNFVDIPTDCPQRNERLGWTGDAQIFAATSLYNFDVHAFWSSWLRTLRDQQSADGRLPVIAPDVAIFGTQLSPAWGDAISIIPWEVYLHTGDLQILKDNYEAMTKYAELYRAKSKDFISPDTGFGDWLQPIKHKNKESRGGETPRELIGSAYFAYTASISAKAAKLLGKSEDAIYYQNTVDAIKQAIRTHFLDDDGRLTTQVETQTGYAILMAFDLVDETLRPKLAAHLARLVAQQSDRLNTGFVGTSYLNRVLDDAGYQQQALDILFTSEYPSWFYSIDQGATTLWERWNSYSHESGFGDAKMNSFNHYAYGAVGRWMYERLAGLEPVEASPGYKHIRIRPLLDSPLNFAEASLETRYGLAKTRWQKTSGKLSMEIVIPPNSTGILQLPVALAEDLQWTNAPTGQKLNCKQGECALVAGHYLLSE
ncbi:alpha-L-rhamnosidase [Catenovulum agarivorans]|uniref:alpha-L-rhamnosidase n=1 Tax=Catenovulum agarivorans TaxID=1172192 RepID=UPI00035E740A|nr:alpha-L-rhamnosidase [Catenovulum agarivorans]